MAGAHVSLEWQVLTGESWSEVVARPLILGVDSNAPVSNGIVSSIFFISFLMVNPHLSEHLPLASLLCPSI